MEYKDISTETKRGLSQAVMNFAKIDRVIEVEVAGGSTWNDGGSCYRAVYLDAHGQHYIASMPTDYTRVIEVKLARRFEDIVVRYE